MLTTRKTRKTREAPAATRWWWSSLGAIALVACGSDGGGAADTSAEVDPCQRDDVDEPATAAALPAEGVLGHLCPIGDADWYRFTVPPGDHLVEVKLAMDGELSPVEPVYVVWSLDGAGAPAAAVLAPPPASIGFPLDDVHCVAPGDYAVVVRDDGEDAEDLRRFYRFSIASAPDPDPAEPNDDAATAVALTDTKTGAIACSGDTDWYAFDGAAGQVARLTLDMDAGRIAPSLRLVDAGGTLVQSQVNPSGTVRDTHLVMEVVLPSAGRYHAIVADDDGRDADPVRTYALGLELLDDSDPNEPNGHPDTATPLAAAAVPCGAEGSAWLEATGTIGAPGDNDWFRLPIGDCGGQGLVEAEVVLPTAGMSAPEIAALAAEVQIAVTLVRRDSGSPCDADLDCQELQKVCDNDYDCSGLFNTCLPDGFCAGAGVCLGASAGGTCAAGVVQRRYEPVGAPTGDQVAHLSAPLFRDPFVFLRVADFQSDGAARGRTYRLRARVRKEPDTNEPSNVYTPTLLADFPANIMADAAPEIPVHDCTSDGVSVPDCCGPDTWVEGYLSYENDLDFYRYLHPCPGEDCNVRLVYELDAGPVDFVLSVYQGDALWFGGVAGAREDLATQPAAAGNYGGASCFYAFQGHGDVEHPYRYHLAVRDLATVRDASATQRYRVCLERTSRACEAPCKLYDNGCGVP